MRGYQSQTTAQCCASIPSVGKGRSVLGNGDRRGLNPQIPNSSVGVSRLHNYYLVPDIPCPIAAQHCSNGTPQNYHGSDLLILLVILLLIILLLIVLVLVYPK